MKLKTLLLIPKIANKNGIIKSRIGIEKKAKVLEENLNIFHYVKNKYKNLKLILIDEAQFLSKKHIYEIINIVDVLKIPVVAYGLKTDFKAHLFEGSKLLIELSDKFTELETLCSKCFKKATMNVRTTIKKKTTKGTQIKINKQLYKPTCRYHYFRYNNSH